MPPLYLPYRAHPRTALSRGARLFSAGGGEVLLPPSQTYFYTDFSTPGTLNTGDWRHQAASWMNAVAVAGGYATAPDYVENFTPSNFNDAYAFLSSWTPSDYSVETTVKKQARGYGECEILLRCADTSTTMRCYEVLTNIAGSLQVVRWNGAWNDFEVLTNGSPAGVTVTDVNNDSSYVTFPTLNNGDRIRVTIVGQQIDVWSAPASNPSAYSHHMRVVDNSTGKFTDGPPGMGFFMRQEDGTIDCGWDDFTVVALPFQADLTSTENPLSNGGFFTNGYGTPVQNNWNNCKIAGRTGGGGNVVCAADFVSTNGGLATNDYNDPIAHVALAKTRFSPNQYAEGTLFLASGYDFTGYSHESELLLRFSITTGASPSARGYEALWGMTGDIVPVRWNGARGDYSGWDAAGQNYNGNPTSLLLRGQFGTTGKHVNGTKMRSQIVGNVWSVWLDAGSGWVEQWALEIDDARFLSVTGNNSVWTDGQPGMGFFPRNEGSVVLESKGWSTWKAGDL